MGAEVQQYIISGDKRKDLIVTLVICVGAVVGSVLFVILFVYILIKCRQTRRRERNQVRQLPIVSDQQIRVLEPFAQQSVSARHEFLVSSIRRFEQEQISTNRLSSPQAQEIPIQQIRYFEPNTQQEFVNPVEAFLRRFIQEQPSSSQLSSSQQVQEVQISFDIYELPISIPSSQFSIDQQSPQKLTPSEIKRFLPLQYFTVSERKYETHRYL